MNSYFFFCKNIYILPVKTKFKNENGAKTFYESGFLSIYYKLDRNPQKDTTFMKFVFCLEGV